MDETARCAPVPPAAHISMQRDNGQGPLVNGNIWCCLQNTKIFSPTYRFSVHTLTTELEKRNTAIASELTFRGCVLVPKVKTLAASKSCVAPFDIEPFAFMKAAPLRNSPSPLPCQWRHFIHVFMDSCSNRTSLIKGN